MYLEWKNCASVLTAALCSCFRDITLPSPICVLLTVYEALWPRFYLLPTPLHQLLWWVLVSLFYRGWKFWGLHRMNCKTTKVLRGGLCTAQTSKNQKRVWTQCYPRPTLQPNHFYIAFTVFCPNLLPVATVPISTRDPFDSLACCDTLIPFQNWSLY